VSSWKQSVLELTRGGQNPATMQMREPDHTRRPSPFGSRALRTFMRGQVICGRVAKTQARAALHNFVVDARWHRAQTRGR